MNTSRLGLDFIIAREALKTTAYRDGGGVWTIGVGHTAMAGPPVPKAGMTITVYDAKEIFARDLVQYEQGVSKAIKRAPNQSQFDAMVSLCFNIGVKGFTGSSVVRNFNAGNLVAAASAFLLWNKDNGKVIPGLVTRRRLEMALFLSEAPEKPVQGGIAAPGPMAPRVAPSQPTATAVSVFPAPEPPMRSWWQRWFGW